MEGRVTKWESQVKPKDVIPKMMLSTYLILALYWNISRYESIKIKISCLKEVSSPTSASLDLIMVMLLFLNSRQFVSLLLDCEGGFYWRILKIMELSALHVDLHQLSLEGCVTLTIWTIPGSDHLFCRTFLGRFTPLLNIPDQGKQWSVSTAQGAEGKPAGWGNWGKPFCAPSPREARKFLILERFQPSGAGRGRAAGAAGEGRPRGRWCPPCSPGQRSAAAPFRSSEDERAGEEGKGKPGGSGGGGAIPGAVPSSRVLEAGTRRCRMRTLLSWSSPAPVAGLEMCPTVPALPRSARSPKAKGVNLSRGAVTTREGFSVQIFRERSKTREKGSVCWSNNDQRTSCLWGNDHRSAACGGGTVQCCQERCSWFS